MEKNKLNLQFGIVAIMIILAALSRLLPHPDNFTPITGMALFGAAHFTKKYWAVLIPLAAMWVSDLVLNNVVYANLYPEYYNGMVLVGDYWVYGSILLIAFIGMRFLKNVKILPLIGVSLVSSVLFFLLTNFGTWMSAWGMTTYPRGFAGLLECYAAGIPFFRSTLLGDLFYVAVLFGAYELIKSRFLSLEPKKKLSL